MDGVCVINAQEVVEQYGALDDSQNKIAEEADANNENGFTCEGVIEVVVKVVQRRQQSKGVSTPR